MAVKTKRSATKRPRQHRRRGRQIVLPTLWRLVRKCWGTLRLFIRAVRASPPFVQAIVIPALLLLLWLSLNWAIHAFKKPSEVLFPLEESLQKNPSETWRQYQSLFHEHATDIITPEFLAALAQVESGGNPIARTYWRGQLAWNPFEWYRPASSAVGMFQITDGTFKEATRYCIHEHVVVEVGPWHALNSCWFNSLYTRVLPSHAIEMTSARLDRRVTEALGIQHLQTTPLQQKQDLAAVIHLCGFGAGQAFVARGLRLALHQHCGSHNVKNYLARLHSLQHTFAKLNPRDKTIRQPRQID